MGPKKVSLYGERLIEEINNYVLENHIDVKWVDKKRKKVILDGETRSNDEIALHMLKEKKNIHGVAEKFYNEEEERLVLSACEKKGYEKISDLKKELPKFMKYETIRAVILKHYFMQ